jgi:hypothetical protein
MQARKMRMAISPRLAAMILLNFLTSMKQTSQKLGVRTDRDNTKIVVPKQYSHYLSNRYNHQHPQSCPAATIKTPSGSLSAHGWSDRRRA